MNARADAGMETRPPAILSSKNKPQTTQKDQGGLIREGTAAGCCPMWDQAGASSRSQPLQSESRGRVEEGMTGDGGT